MTDRLLLLAGVAVLALLWLGPLPHLAAERFSAHMAMHMGVVAVAAPLLALGTRRATVRGAGDRLLAGAIAASVVELVTVWGWHTPVLHHAARTSAAALVAEQSTFLISAFLVWWLSYGERLSPGDGSDAAAAPADASLSRAGAGVAALLLTSMHMTLLGALIALAPRPLYTHLMPAAAALDDQHLGGAIMLVTGGIVYLAGGVALAARLVTEPRSSAIVRRHG
jgi:putative membrane protein